MKQIKYGFYGEDDAHKIFLHNYLSTLEPAVFERDEEFCSRFRANTKKQVDTKFAEVAAYGFAWYQHDVFFVTRDVDSSHRTDFEARHIHFTTQNIRNLLVMLPVQCIEHWLWYLKYYRENPSSTKNISLEMQDRHKAKVEVYSHKDPPNRISNPIVSDLTEKLNIPWLESRSESFRHFHQQVVTFLMSHKTTQP